MSARQLMPCGTNAAYQRHIVDGEDADDACRAAHRAYCTGWDRKVRAEGRELEPCTSCGDERHGRGGPNGWCVACYHRWLRADRPADGPPPAPGARREDYAFLREQGVPIEEAATRVGIEATTALDKWEPRRLRELAGAVSA